MTSHPRRVACLACSYTDVQCVPCLLCSYNELLELQLVLERAASFFEDARAHADVGRYDRPAFGDGEHSVWWLYRTMHFSLKQPLAMVSGQCSLCTVPLSVAWMYSCVWRSGTLLAICYLLLVAHREGRESVIRARKCGQQGLCAGFGCA